MAEEIANQEEKKSGGIKRILLYVLLASLLLGLGFGAGYFIFGMGQKTPAEEIELIIEKKLQESGIVHSYSGMVWFVQDEDRQDI